MSKKKSTQQFKDELLTINPTIEIIGEYVNNKIPILYRCKQCGNTHSATPSMLLKGQGCPKCAIIKRSTNRTKTHLQFMKEIEHKVNPDIEIVGEYVTSKTKIKCVCKECGYEFYSLPYNISRGHGCTQCEHNKGFEKRRKSQDEFQQELNCMSLDFVVLDKYYNAKTKLKCQCLVCGTEWYSYPTNIILGQKCPRCTMNDVKVKQTMSKTEFIEKVHKINSQIEVIGEYTNNATPIECKCLKCENSFKIIPRNLLTRATCPICTISKGENEINKWLFNHNIAFEQQKTFDNLYGIGGGRLRYDFFLPDYNMLIEYNGIQHEKPVDFGAKGKSFSENQYNKQKENDEIKRQYANQNDITLLEIWYYDFDRISEILSKELIKK